MPIQAQTIDIPIGGGVDEKTRPELVEPGSLASTSNLQHTKTGALYKRPGTVSVSNALFIGGNLAAGKRCFGYRDELCVVDGTQLVSRGATANALVSAGDPHGSQGRIPGEALVSRLPVAPLGTACAQFDVAYANGYYLVVWAQPIYSGGPLTIFGTVVDATNGAVVVTATNLAAGGAGDVTVSLAAAAIGTKLVVLSGLRNSSNIDGLLIDTASSATLEAGFFGAGSPVTDAYNTATDPANFDVVTLDDRIAVVYTNNVLFNPRNTVKTLNFVGFTLTQIARSDSGTAIATGAVAIGGTQTDRILVAAQVDATTTVRVYCLDAVTLAAAGTSTSVVVTPGAGPTRMSITRTGAASGYVVADDSIGTITCRPFNVPAAAVVALSTQVTRYNTTSASKAFVTNGRLYIMVRPLVPTLLNQQYICVDLLGNSTSLLTAKGPYLRPVASVTPRLAVAPSGGPASPTVPPHAVLVGAKAMVGSITARTTSSASLDLVTLDFAASNRWQPASFAEVVCMSGGVPSYYDGGRTSEQGFLLAPTAVVANILAGPGISCTAVTYVAVYEQYDTRGQRHQSAPSVPSAPVSPANQLVLLSTASLYITGRISDATAVTNPIRVVYYRTTTGGTVYYRLPGSESLNDPTAPGTATFADTTIDALLATQQPLYTQPGVPGSAQPRVSPPSFLAHVTHGDRLVGIDGANVWVSGQQVYGEGVWWSDAFVYPQTGGDLTAVWSMDGRIVAFGRSRIIYLDGAGPPDNGYGGEYVSQNIATPVGCIEPRSLVTIPTGTIFRSLRGFELLTRGMQVQEPFFGRAVEATLAAFPVVTSAVNHEALGRVIFTLVATEGASTGTTVEYDYVHGTWAVAPRGDGTVPGAGAASAALIGNQPGTMPTYTWITSAGKIYQESTSSYLDNAAWVTGQFETPWIKTGSGAGGPNISGGIQGFQRLRHVLALFQSMSPHDLTVSLAFDYSPSYTETHTFTWAQLGALARGNVDVHVANQRCQAVRVKVVDLTPSSGTVGTGQGPVFLGLALEVGVIAGRARLPAGAKG